MMATRQFLGLAATARLGALLAWAARPTFAPRRSADVAQDKDLTEDLERSLDADAATLRRIAAELGKIQLQPAGGSSPNDSGISNSEFAPERRRELAQELAATRLRFAEASDTQARIAALSDFTLPHQVYVRYGGGLQYLGFLNQIVAEEQSPELRKLAIIACHSLSHKEVVDALIDWLRSPHKEVSYFAAEGLAWVPVQESARAHGALLATLNDEDADVREVTALALAIAGKQAEDVTALLARLAREDDPEVISALKDAIIRLDPKEGWERIAQASRHR